MLELRPKLWVLSIACGLLLFSASSAAFVASSVALTFALCCMFICSACVLVVCGRSIVFPVLRNFCLMRSAFSHRQLDEVRLLTIFMLFCIYACMQARVFGCFFYAASIFPPRFQTRSSLNKAMAWDRFGWHRWPSLSSCCLCPVSASRLLCPASAHLH